MVGCHDAAVPSRLGENILVIQLPIDPRMGYGNFEWQAGFARLFVILTAIISTDTEFPFDNLSARLDELVALAERYNP